MKALYAYFSIFFMESTALIFRWLLRWNLLFCLDMMANSNKIRTWKWNYFKARLISWTKLKWRRLKMLLCGCMSRVGDCKASMSLIGWIPWYGIDIIFLWFSYFKKLDQFPGKSILRGQLNKDIKGYLFASVEGFLPTHFQPQKDQFFDQLLSQNFFPWQPASSTHMINIKMFWFYKKMLRIPSKLQEASHLRFSPRKS